LSKTPHDFVKTSSRRSFKIEELVSQLNDLTMEVEGKEKVRIGCE